jgi:type VI secretion system VasD/TssJ family lipoprotein
LGLLLLVGQSLVSGCAKKGPDPIPPPAKAPSSVVLVVQSGPNCNQCGASRAALNFRVIQLKNDVDPGTDMVSFWDSEQARLGDNFVFMETGDLFVEAGGTKQVTVQVKPDVHAIMVEGNYCNSPAHWSYHQALDPKSKKIHLNCGPDGFGLVPE